MEDELFAQLYRAVGRLATPRRRRELYSDATILLVYCWAVLHDRPTSWACQQRHWPACQRHWPKPSPSRMSRRLRAPAVQELLDRVETHLRPPGPPPLVKTIDAKPLPVGGFSKDRDATWGYAAKSRARGYKLFALTDAHGILAWEVRPLHSAEALVARSLIPRIDGAGYLLGDALYDANDLHLIAGLCNHQLLAPRRKPHTGLGHHPACSLRRRSIDLLEDRAHRPFGPGLYALRTGIERTFGHMTSFAGGLGPLPSWVRTLPRVRRWVHAKIIFNALRLQRLRQKQRLRA